MARLGDFITQIRGVSYKPEDVYNELTEESVPILRANNIQDDGLNFDDLIYINKQKISSQQMIKRGDIIICTSSGSKNLVGKAAIAKEDLSMSFGAFCKVVRTNKYRHEYLGYFFQSSSYRNKICELAGGANINNIRNEHIDNLEIPLFQEDEQGKLIAELDKISNLIEKRKTQLEKMDMLVKARFVEMFGNNKYESVKACEVCHFITKGATPSAGDIFETYQDGLIPYIKVYNLSMTGELLFDSEPQYITKNIHNGKLARSKVYPNDVLMNIVGPPLGKFSLVTNEFDEWNINQAIAIFRAKDKVLPRYLMSALMQPDVLRPFLNQAVGIRQLNLSLEQCRNLQFPLPPLKLQNQFSAFVACVDKSKLEIQKSLEKLETLKKALMQKYFG